MIILFNLPVPPSVNKIYENRIVPAKPNFNFGSKKRFSVTRKKADCLLSFESKLNLWMILNKESLSKAESFMNNNINLGNLISVDCYINVPISKMMTKEKTKGRGDLKMITEISAPKGVDTNNYLKAALDGLTKLTGIDDKYFIKGIYEKTSKESGLECMTLVIKGTTIRQYLSLKKELLAQQATSAEIWSQTQG